MGGESYTRNRMTSKKKIIDYPILLKKKVNIEDNWKKKK